MTRTRVALAREWHVAPGALRDATLAELQAMVGLINGASGDDDG